MAMQILAVNISKTVTDRTNIAIVNTYEVAFWLSIDVVTFDLDPYSNGQGQGHAYIS